MSARARSQRIRPSKSWSGDNFFNKDPASITVKHRPIDVAAYESFAAAMFDCDLEFLEEERLRRLLAGKVTCC